MMRNKTSRGPEPERLQTPIPVLDLAQPTIRFQRLPLPDMGLQFPPKPALLDSRKRGRAAADIDGEHSCLQKKKRRLRLFLITSRLSPQFSHPATNIVDRGSSKIAVWAKQKALGRNLLRKAAILNRIRRGAVSARGAVPGRGRLLVEQEKEQRQLEMARLTFNYGSIDTYTRPVHLQPHSTPPRNGNQHLFFSSSPTTSPSTSPNPSRSPSPPSISPPSHLHLHDNPLPPGSPNAAYALSPPRTHPSRTTYEPHLPSPLGLSNYDALDVEDNDDDDDADASESDLYAHFDEGDAFASYYWDEGAEERHDSPFSNEVDVRCWSEKTLSRMVDKNGSGVAALLGFDDTDADADAHVDVDADVDSTWPSPFLDATPTNSLHSAVYPVAKFSHRDLRTLAVRYPGEPVVDMVADRTPLVQRSVPSPKMVPACMSPNFLPADVGGWVEEG
ncbi:hypothetical protein M3J07_002229 [Ascochyta lentis]